jgi:hypothetical protein
MNSPSEEPANKMLISKKSMFAEWLSQKSNLDSISSAASSIHQGHLLLATSLAFGFLAYRDYHRPLDDVIQKALLKSRYHAKTIQDHQNQNHLPLMNIESASDDIKRAMGSITAVRALRVATIATVSMFAFTGAISLYATGCTTFQEFFALTRRWAVAKRQTLDEVLGVDQRVHRDQHPDIAATQGMSEEQELDYVYKTYFPQDEMVDPNSDGEQKDSK